MPSVALSRDPYLRQAEVSRSKDLRSRRGQQSVREQDMAVSAAPSEQSQPEDPPRAQLQTHQHQDAGPFVSLYHSPFLVSLIVGGFVFVVFGAVAFSIYRRRQRARTYENIPEGLGPAGKRPSRCSQASIYSCINQNRPIDFVVPNIPTTLATLPSPAESASLSSSSSSEVSFWSRLALLDGGPTLLGGLNPELYKVEAEPEEEVYFPDGHVGRMWFGLEFDSSAERLMVTMIKAKNLPSRVCGSVNCCDPFVRIYILPDERRYSQSKQKKKTCNPKFDETFVFQVPSRALDERTLRLTVFDNDRGKRHNIIGHVDYPLKELDVTSTEMVVLWRDLEKDSGQGPNDLGEMLVSLCYNQNLERLTVTVCEAKGLSVPEGTTSIDSCVKLSLMIENKVVKTKKTLVNKKALEPKYNESFHFRLPQRAVNSASITLQLALMGGVQKDKILGRIVLGSFMFVRGKGLDHWNETMAAGHKQIRYWHKLT